MVNVKVNDLNILSIKYILFWFYSIGNCLNVKCPSDKICLLVKNTGEPICYPRKHCNPTLSPEPVCGTNGVTYPNICAMRFSHDKHGRTPELAHKGSCGMNNKTIFLLFFFY
jgi:hypothetical protein